MADIRAGVANQGSNIASDTSIDLGAATGQYVKITGTTTITGLGTVAAGTTRDVEFTGALTFTHNATSLILPGGANITTAAGDCARLVSEGSGNWRCLFYTRASGAAVAITFATDAQVRSAATGDLPLKASLIESASAAVALTDDTSVALDWDAGINFTLAIAGNRTLANPSNGQPGTWRTILVTQDSNGTRTLAYGNQYVFPGAVAPTIATGNGAISRIMVFCRTSSIFEVYGSGIGLAA